MDRLKHLILRLTAFLAFASASSITSDACPSLVPARLDRVRVKVATFTEGWSALTHTRQCRIRTAMPSNALTACAWLLFVAVALIESSATSYALAEEPTLAEMNHKSWTARDGAPQGITALAQTPDGVLWIGTVGGLFTFDGHTFSAYQPQAGEPDLPAGEIRALLAARDGAIWLGYWYGGIARISQGHVKLFTQADQLRLISVDHLQQSSDGRLWALNRQMQLIRFDADGRWHIEPTPLADLSAWVRTMFIDSSNTLWIGQGGRLYRRPLNQAQYFATGIQVDWPMALVEMPDHSLWINDLKVGGSGVPTSRTLHIDSEGKLLAHLAFTGSVWNLLYSPDGSLIMITYSDGILRFSAEALAEPEAANNRGPHDTYGEKNGLSSNSVRAVLLDIEGNIWTAGQRGLDRFRKARLTPFNTKYAVAGPPAVCTGADGTVWILVFGSTDAIYERSAVTTKLFVPSSDLTSISCGRDGETLVVANDGIFRIHADRMTRIPSIPGAHGYDVFQVVATSDHALFASVEGFRGIWRYVHGSWTRLTDPGIPARPPFIEYVDSKGRLWTGNPDGMVGLPLEGGGRMLSSGDPGLGHVFTILETSHGLIAGGLNGLAVLRDDRFEMLDFADRIASRGVGGIVESANGDLWLNASRGIVRIPSSELQTALRTPRYAMRSELLTEGEFAGPVELKYGGTTAARDGQGHLWFATMNGVFHIDPDHLTSQSRAPNLLIRSISVDGKPLNKDGSIGPGPEALEIHYLGVNLTTPESVIYKYRLDGLENAWQEAGHATQAIYKRLRPGRYTFRVMASNGDGVWTEPVSSAPFRVLPRFYQTAWFIALCVAAVLALLFALYRLRLLQLQRRHDALNRSRMELAHVARLATLSTMTASITHEVSQPISGILTNSNTCARMLAADPPNVEGAAETVRRTIRDANRATEVIKRVRTMFAKKAPTIEMVDLNDAAREIITMSASELRQNGSVLQTEFAEPLPAIFGDRVQLQQVILNLLLNGADAMAGIEDRPRTLRVETAFDRGDTVKLLVRDSGVGLDPRGVEKLFEAFYSTKAHGLGIGLAISRSIVESHKGQLWAVANDGPGATFGFSIPCAGHATTDTAAITNAESQARTDVR
jgi:signal transduction histidine kinase/ligand-binding sensor domain-containing protein